MTETRVGILLAEDTDDMRFLLDAAFRGTRFDIVGIAGDGDEALALWREHGDRIGAVALDQRMPGTDGLTVARAMRADRPDLPIVLFSAELEADLRRAADELGVGVLTKDAILTLPDHPAFAPTRA